MLLVTGNNSETTLLAPSPVVSINPVGGWKIDAHRG